MYVLCCGPSTPAVSEKMSHPSRSTIGNRKLISRGVERQELKVIQYSRALETPIYGKRVYLSDNAICLRDCSLMFGSLSYPVSWCRYPETADLQLCYVRRLSGSLYCRWNWSASALGMTTLRAVDVWCRMWLGYSSGYRQRKAFQIIDSQFPTPREYLSLWWLIIWNAKGFIYENQWR